MLVFIRHFFETIAHTELPMGIPLDVVLHFVLGAIFFLIAYKLFNKKLLPSLGVIFLIAISKELFDMGVVIRKHLYFEPFKDILVTMIGAATCLIPLKNTPKIQKVAAKI